MTRARPKKVPCRLERRAEALSTGSGRRGGPKHTNRRFKHVDVVVLVIFKARGYPVARVLQLRCEVHQDDCVEGADDDFAEAARGWCRW